MNAPITINPARIDLDEAYMQMAEVWARRSKANRKQVGALIVKDRQIISDGYNGMPAGDRDDTCEEWYFDPNDEVSAGSSVTPTLRTKPEVLHAESNALAKIAENGGVGAQGGTLYVTMSPCKECAKLIKQAKIKRVVFREQYRDDGGVYFLRSRGVVVEQLTGTAQPQPQPQPVAPPAAQPVQVPDILRDSTNQDLSRMRTLAAVAGKSAPVAPPPAPIASNPNEPVFIDDMAAALAAAGITLVNGVPVETPTEKPKAPPTDDGSYKSTFF